MLNIDLLKNVLIIAIAGGIVSSLLIQKIKEALSSKKWLVLISFIVNMIIGTLFAKCFSNIEWLYCAWSGLFGFVDATILYAMLEDKVFKSFNSIKKDEEQMIDTIMDLQDDNEAVG